MADSVLGKVMYCQSYEWRSTKQKWQNKWWRKKKNNWDGCHIGLSRTQESKGKSEWGRELLQSGEFQPNICFSFQQCVPLIRNSQHAHTNTYCIFTRLCKFTSTCKTITLPVFYPKQRCSDSMYRHSYSSSLLSIHAIHVHTF